jgi:Domain of unknown function (DUF4384)
MRSLLSLILTNAIFMILACPALCYAAEQPLVLEVSGEASGSELESPAEVCQRARNQAQRAAIEQAVGTFVSSFTLVSNSQLADDLILTQVRGRLESAEVLQEERSLAGCRVRLKAKVLPVYPDSGELIQINSSLSRSALKDGEELSISYQLSRDGYVYIFVVAADNSVTQLLPNREMTQNFARGGERFVFPPQFGSLKLNAHLLPAFKQSGADERVKLIVTRNPEPILERGFQEGFAVYDAKSTALVSDLLKRLSQLAPADWGEVTMEYRIQP